MPTGRSAFVVCLAICGIVTTQKVALAASCDDPAPPCVPNPGEVCLYEHANCGGSYTRVSAQTIWGVLNSSNFDNDILSSFKLGDRTELYLCSDANFGGYCVPYYRYDAWGLDQSQDSLPIPYLCKPADQTCNDLTSSVRVSAYSYPHPCTAPPADRCAFFKDANFGNSCVVLPVGVYDNSGAFGLPNDSISSIRCGSGVKATLYEHAGRGGSTYGSPYTWAPSLGSANDKTSSISVVRR
jgi:hypothetical protein